MSGEYGLASARSASFRLCGQARANFKCVTAAFKLTVTWTKPLYIILHFSFSLLLFFSLRWSTYVTRWALSRLVTHGASYLWGKRLLRDERRWLIIYDNVKDNCALVLTRRFTISFQEQMRAKARRWRKLLPFFDCKLENTNIGGKKVKTRFFSIGHLFTAIFKAVHY